MIAGAEFVPFIEIDATCWCSGGRTPTRGVTDEADGPGAGRYGVSERETPALLEAVHLRRKALSRQHLA
jgi:hypothetical protein